MRGVVDNDVLHKAASYGLLGDLLPPPSADSNETPYGYLAAAKYMIPKKVARSKLAKSRDEVNAALAEWFSRSEALESSLEELGLAAELETVAQRLGVALDPGESQLCAVVIKRGVPLLLTGDKRAIAALEPVIDAAPSAAELIGRVRCLEQLLSDLARRIGLKSVRDAICAEPAADRSLSIIFSCTNSSIGHESIAEGFKSYIDSLRGSAPRVLSAD